MILWKKYHLRQKNSAIFTDEKSDIRGTLLQSFSPQILLSVIQTSLQNFDISTRRLDTERINFRFRASNYIEWSLLVEFAQYCIKHLRK